MRQYHNTIFLDKNKHKISFINCYGNRNCHIEKMRFKKSSKQIFQDNTMVLHDTKMLWFRIYLYIMHVGKFWYENITVDLDDHSTSCSSTMSFGWFVSSCWPYTDITSGKKFPKHRKEAMANVLIYRNHNTKYSRLKDF